MLDKDDLLSHQIDNMDFEQIIKNPAVPGFLDNVCEADQIIWWIYLILASLYITYLRIVGSNFFISSFSGMVRLFLVVV